MGLILLPAIIFWFGMAIYSIKISYALMMTAPSSGYSITVAAIGVSGVALFVMLGLNYFKGKTSLDAFEIFMFFTMNKFVFLPFLAAILAYWFAGDYLTNDNLKAIPIIVMFVISISSLVGAFSADSFMAKHGITKTH